MKLYFWPKKNQLGVWTRNHGFDFLGLERYEVDTLAGDFWVDGSPEYNGWVYVGEL